VKRTIGRLNTETSDGRIIRKLHLSDDPIPVLVRDEDDPAARVVGTALVTTTDDGDVVADIDLRNSYRVKFAETGTTVTKFEDLTPHMSCVVVNPDADEMALANIYLDDQPDAFGDLNR
jgi:hypothetical protein